MASSAPDHLRTPGLISNRPCYEGINLGNFLRRLCLPKAVRHWSLRSVQVKLIKMGGRLVRHSRLLIFQLSEVSVPRRLFQGVLDRIGRLSPAPS